MQGRDADENNDNGDNFFNFGNNTLWLLLEVAVAQPNVQVVAVVVVIEDEPQKEVVI